MENPKVCKAKNCMHCRYCGKTIVWQKGCRNSLKDMVRGNIFMELCMDCMKKIAKYWLELHGI